MRKAFIILLIISSFNVKSQVDSIQFGAKFGSDNEEISELYQLINIENYQFNLPVEKIKNKKITFSYVEYKDGEFSKEKPLFRNGLDMGKVSTNLVKDSLYTFKITGVKQNKESVDLWMRFPLFGLSRLTLQLDSSVSNRYSLRDFLTTTGRKHENISQGKKVPFLTYILPYEKDGMLYYCSVLSEGSNPETWGKKYNIPHYAIFYIKIE